jgi:hypothetical protein
LAADCAGRTAIDARTAGTVLRKGTILTVLSVRSGARCPFGVHHDAPAAVGDSTRRYQAIRQAKRAKTGGVRDVAL